MLTELVILGPPNNKAEAPDSLSTSSAMVFMPLYLKIHLSLIALLTHVLLTLQPRYLEELRPQACLSPGEGLGERRQRHRHWAQEASCSAVALGQGCHLPGPWKGPGVRGRLRAHAVPLPPPFISSLDPFSACTVKMV